MYVPGVEVGARYDVTYGKDGVGWTTPHCEGGREGVRGGGREQGSDRGGGS